jgi:uncharacterized protein (TIGR02145 family)
MYKIINTTFILSIFMGNIFNISAQEIETVEIGNQKWTIRNLEVVTFRNGDTIPEAKNDLDWLKASNEEKPAWCYFENDTIKGNKLGKLYNWFAVNDKRGLAPYGFHIPTKTEWDNLVAFLGGQNLAGNKMKSIDGWENSGNGTNESGFNGLPGSMRHYNGYFEKNQTYGRWWSSTEFEYMYAWQYYLTSKEGAIGWFSRDYGKGAGMSVRCILNN